MARFGTFVCVHVRSYRALKMILAGTFRLRYCYGLTARHGARGERQ